MTTGHEKLRELDQRVGVIEAHLYRPKEPPRKRTQAELEAVMIGNGATPAEAKRDAGQIFRNLYG